MKAMAAAVVLAVGVLGGCGLRDSGVAPGFVGTWRLEQEAIGSYARPSTLEMTLDASGGATTTLVERVPLDAKDLAGCRVTRVDASAHWEVDGAELVFDGGGKVVYARSECASAADDEDLAVRDVLEAEKRFAVELAADGEELIVHHTIGGRQVDQTFTRVRR